MTAPRRPNFLIIIADDLGYSDLGCYGGEIKTPNLDRLASQGSRFTNFHTASACSPTRSMLMSGTDNHIAGVGCMVEHMSDEYAQELWGGKPGHEGHLLHSVAALPEVLKDAGYHTILAGKWHLGLTKETMPAARGFDKSFALLSGGHNHYGWEPQFTVGDPDDEHWKVWQPSNYSSVNMYARDHQHMKVEPNVEGRPDGFFSTVSFTDELLNYLDARPKDKPFFAYHAFTAPHFPLQASKERVAKYRGMYDDGPNALKERRLQGMIKLGLMDEDVKPHEMANALGLKEWQEMTLEERQKSSRAMEAYAAMVEQLDENVGRVLDYLEREGEMDNTFIIFMSDNGAEGASYEAYPTIGPTLTRTINKHYNNDLDNIGQPDSFVWYGNFWAQASTAPGWLYKMWTSQGGIRVPLILRYPHLLAQSHTPGDLVQGFSTVMDLMPTLLDLAGATHPAAATPQGQLAPYKGGRKVVPMRGKSWVPWLSGQVGELGYEGTPMGWELHGRAAMRLGDWKILWMPPPQGAGKWQLFNVKADPGETEDLCMQEEAKMKELLELWDQYVATSQVVWGEPRGYGEVVEMDETDDPKGWMNAKASRKKRPML